MAGKVENKKLEEYENGTITCFGDRTSGTFLKLIASVSRTKITRSHGPITLICECECFQQCYISSCTLLPLRFALFLNNASGP